ncbi:MAG: DUF3662 domain-containing protein [Clostridia bacterium]|nr:DUF3662 domain-containing protein [Clostridia bacterium]
MGFFSSLEGSLEKYIEGFFKDRFRGQVQPIEIAKKLKREMYNNKRVSIKEVYVPNKYIVYLYPEDYETVLTINEDLSKELRGYLVHSAKERKLTMTSPPDISFQEDPRLSQGRIRVETSFEEAPQQDGGNLGDTLEYNGLVGSIVKKVGPSSPQPTARLRIVEGLAEGKVHNLSSWPAVLGRREGSHVVLVDSSVSRQHAQIEYRGGEFIISDLGSTNHTYVNEKMIDSQVLRSGDYIRVGNTVCVFEVQ